jgi:hypothetical protein
VSLAQKRRQERCSFQINRIKISSEYIQSIQEHSENDFSVQNGIKSRAFFPVCDEIPSSCRSNSMIISDILALPEEHVDYRHIPEAGRAFMLRPDGNVWQLLKATKIDIETAVQI